MPFGRITVAADELTAAQGRSLVGGLTDRLAHDLRKKPDVTVVHLNRVPRSSWFVEGAEATGLGVHVEVSITAGTNTEDEKARFIRNVYDLVKHEVPGAVDTIYVALYELAADAYGYGGVTQAVRYGAGGVLPA